MAILEELDKILDLFVVTEMHFYVEYKSGKIKLNCENFRKRAEKHDAPTERIGNNKQAMP